MSVICYCNEYCNASDGDYMKTKRFDRSSCAHVMSSMINCLLPIAKGLHQSDENLHEIIYGRSVVRKMLHAVHLDSDISCICTYEAGIWVYVRRNRLIQEPVKSRCEDVRYPPHLN